MGSLEEDRSRGRMTREMLSKILTPILRRALALREKALGPDHPDVAHSLYDVGELYQAQGRTSEAERLYVRAQAILERTGGPRDPWTVLVRRRLGELRGKE